MPSDIKRRKRKARSQPLMARMAIEPIRYRDEYILIYQVPIRNKYLQ